MRRRSLALDRRSYGHLAKLAPALDVSHSAVVRMALDFLAEHLHRADPKTREAARQLAREKYATRNA
jgi:hypothetical protein